MLVFSAFNKGLGTWRTVWGVPAGSATKVGMEEVQNADSLREREWKLCGKVDRDRIECIKIWWNANGSRKGKIKRVREATNSVLHVLPNKTTDYLFLVYLIWQPVFRVMLVWIEKAVSGSLFFGTSSSTMVQRCPTIDDKPLTVPKICLLHMREKVQERNEHLANTSGSGIRCIQAISVLPASSKYRWTCWLTPWSHNAHKLARM